MIHSIISDVAKFFWIIIDDHDATIVKHIWSSTTREVKFCFILIGTRHRLSLDKFLPIKIVCCDAVRIALSIFSDTRIYFVFFAISYDESYSTLERRDNASCEIDYFPIFVSEELFVDSPWPSTPICLRNNFDIRKSITSDIRRCSLE